MPPKKGKKGGKKGNKKGNQQDNEVVEPVGTPVPSDKEVLLQKELDKLTEEMEEVKTRVEELRKENEWLQQEAHKVRVESHEYMCYMEKKTSKRQTTIISLSDQNQKEINDLNDQKADMKEEYEEKKTALRATLMEKENFLAKTRQEIEDLKEYKSLQSDQLSKISELQSQVSQMRRKHSEALQQLKAQFLKEKHMCQQESEHKIASMSKQANREAMQCLDSHTQRITQENRRLRHQLLLYIRKTVALHEHRKHLEEQRRQLLAEQQYAQDLKTIRTARQHQVYKTFGMLPAAAQEKTAAK